MDNGSSVNAMPLCVMQELGISTLEPVLWCCQGYDGSEKTPLGSIPIPLTLKDKTVVTDIVVLDVDINYNLLLGRPWLDQMGAVCSTRWGQLKFIHNGQMKVVSRERSLAKQARPSAQASHGYTKGNKRPYDHVLACSIGIPDSSYREEDPISSSPDLMRFTPIGVGSYGYLTMFDDDGSHSEDEDRPHPVSFLCTNVGHPLSPRFPPRTPFVI